MPPLTDLDPVDFLRLVDRRRTNNALLTYRPGMVLPGQAFSRTTVATYFDANGIAQQAPINGLRDAHYIGGGTRTNLVIHSQFDSLAGYGGGPTGTTLNADRAPDGTLTAMTWTGAGRLFQEPASANATYTPSVYVRLVSGTATVQLVLKDNQTDTVRATVNATATGAWQRVVCPSGLTAAAAPGFRVEISVVGGVAPVIALWGLQVEAGAAVTGLIPTVAAPVTVFDGGVRTTLLEGARTNSALWSRDLTNAAWVKTGTGTATQNAVGLDGTANSATTLVDSDAAAAYSAQQSSAVANDAAAHAVSFWVKKDTDQTRFVGLQLFLGGGTTTVSKVAHLNTQTGAITAESSPAGTTQRVVDGGLWWIVELIVTNNTTGNVTLAPNIYPARGTVAGTLNVAATGSCVVGQVQVELNSAFASSPIFTTTVAVNRGADSLSFPFNYAGAPLTVYSKHSVIGLGSGANWRIVVGRAAWSAAGGDKNLALFVHDTSVPRVSVNNGAAFVDVLGATAVAGGDTLETLCAWQADGTPYVDGTINGTPFARATGSAVPLPAAFSAPIVAFQTGVNFGALQVLKIVSGVRSLAAMRSL